MARGADTARVYADVALAVAVDSSAFSASFSVKPCFSLSAATRSRWFMACSFLFGRVIGQAACFACTPLLKYCIMPAVQALRALLSGVALGELFSGLP